VTLQHFKVIQGHRSWYQSKAHARLSISQLPFSRYWRLKLENRWIFQPHPSLRFGGNPLEFGDELWRQKTRVLGRPDGEEIMVFVLAQYRRVTDRQTRCDPYHPREHSVWQIIMYGNTAACNIYTHSHDCLKKLPPSLSC